MILVLPSLLALLAMLFGISKVVRVWKLPLLTQEQRIAYSMPILFADAVILGGIIAANIHPEQFGDDRIDGTIITWLFTGGIASMVIGILLLTLAPQIAATRRELVASPRKIDSFLPRSKEVTTGRVRLTAIVTLVLGGALFFRALTWSSL
jgi:hypothetical protein